ncbi:MAG: RNA polymerase sigma-I factor [Clostridia bacterium]|nr:RNA polymerase sigma-I factor [Clostridia bacterium]
MVGNDPLLQLIIDIQQGDTTARERFLEEYQPFVAKVATSLCKRYLDWGRDDELSIGLIAFNGAIDTFQPDKGVPFLPYAQVVIRNRLKDYFKKESRAQHESLWLESDSEDIFSPAEIKAAWEEYQNRTIEDERQTEIEYFERVLADYKIDFEDLTMVSPKHRDTRETLFSVARILVSNKELFDYLLAKKQLPLKELGLATGVNRKTLERGRKFIIALAVILQQPEEFIYLKSYISV